MRKLSYVLVLLAMAAACNSNDSKAKTDTVTEDSTADKPMDPEAEKGMNLAANTYACFSCHDISVKKLGPSYEAVAEKYPDSPANIDTLAQHVMKGSVGRWGTALMPANADVTEADAKSMVHYILSLK